MMNFLTSNSSEITEDDANEIFSPNLLNEEENDLKDNSKEGQADTILALEADLKSRDDSILDLQHLHSAKDENIQELKENLDNLQKYKIETENYLNDLKTKLNFSNDNLIAAKTHFESILSEKDAAIELMNTELIDLKRANYVYQSSEALHNEETAAHCEIINEKEQVIETLKQHHKMEVNNMKTLTEADAKTISELKQSVYALAKQSLEQRFESAALSKNLKCLQIKIQNSEKSIDFVTNERINLQNSVEFLENKVMEFDLINKNLDIEKSELEKKYNDFKTEKEKEVNLANVKETEFLLEKKIYQEEIEKLNAKCEKSQQLKVEAEKNLENSFAQIKELKEVLESQNITIEKLSEVESTLNCKTLEVKKLTCDLEVSNAELRSKSSDITILQEKYLDTEKCLELASKNMELLQNEYEEKHKTLSDEYKCLQSENVALKTTLEQKKNLDIALDEANLKILEGDCLKNTLQQEIENHCSTIKLLEKNLEKLEVDEIAKLISEKNELEKKFTALTESKNAFEASNAAIKTEYSLLQDAQQAAEKECCALQSSLSKISEELLASNCNSKNLLERFNDIQSQLMEVQAINEKNELQLINSSKEKSDLESANTEISEALKLKEIDYEKLLVELKKSTYELSSVKETCSEIDSLLNSEKFLVKKISDEFKNYKDFIGNTIRDLKLDATSLKLYMNTVAHEMKETLATCEEKLKNEAMLLSDINKAVTNEKKEITERLQIKEENLLLLNTKQEETSELLELSKQSLLSERSLLTESKQAFEKLMLETESLREAGNIAKKEILSLQEELKNALEINIKLEKQYLECNELLKGSSAQYDGAIMSKTSLEKENMSHLENLKIISDENITLKKELSEAMHEVAITRKSITECKDMLTTQEKLNINEMDNLKDLNRGLTQSLELAHEKFNNLLSESCKSKEAISQLELKLKDALGSISSFENEKITFLSEKDELQNNLRTKSESCEELNTKLNEAEKEAALSKITTDKDLEILKNEVERLNIEIGSSMKVVDDLNLLIQSKSSELEVKIKNIENLEEELQKFASHNSELITQNEKLIKSTKERKLIQTQQVLIQKEFESEARCIADISDDVNQINADSEKERNTGNVFEELQNTPKDDEIHLQSQEKKKETVSKQIGISKKIKHSATVSSQENSENSDFSCQATLTKSKNTEHANFTSNIKNDGDLTFAKSTPAIRTPFDSFKPPEIIHKKNVVDTSPSSVKQPLQTYTPDKKHNANFKAKPETICTPNQELNSNICVTSDNAVKRNVEALGKEKLDLKKRRKTVSGLLSNHADKATKIEYYICFSGFKEKTLFDSSLKKKLTKQISKLNNAEILPSTTEIDPRTTHLISPAGSRTLKTLSASLMQIWIIYDPEWINQSFINGNFLPENQYGIKNVSSPFQGKKYFLSQSFHNDNLASARKDVYMDYIQKLIVVIGKGEITSNLEDADIILKGSLDAR
ncbi:hypothetical protein HK099_002637 [Clydaea vesicula]|uniref:BRCT domain-containing protein n=1 Tax=Clydaea vesicula TaxID=447962 RepID=A0AAD5Y3R4_9FUNG|nr:hypothetical protein HK099_002637 [Clydaea vesicula]